MMDGDPSDPSKESWGGSFVRLNRSPRNVFSRNTTLADTVNVYSIVEFHFKGPEINIPRDSSCFTMVVKAKIGEQQWSGYYEGNGNYVIRYSPKQTEILSYKVVSSIPGFVEQDGQFVVNNTWPGKSGPDDYKLGAHWYTDKPNVSLFVGIQQGAMTINKWRTAVLLDWAKRWTWLR